MNICVTFTYFECILRTSSDGDITKLKEIRRESQVKRHRNVFSNTEKTAIHIWKTIT